MYAREVDIYKNWSIKEVEDINSSVTNMIAEIVYLAFRNQELLHIPRDQVANHMRAMGSMREGTKIKSPNEFDFQVYFPHFSSSNVAIMWDNELVSCAKLKYLNTSHNYSTNSPFKKIISNNLLTVNLITLFQTLVTPVLKNLYDNKFNIVVDSGILSIVAGETKDRLACVTLYLQWKSTNNDREPVPINVDCVPSINISSRDIFKRMKPISDKLSEILSLDNKILSPPSQEAFTIGIKRNETYRSTFCLSFAKTQFDLMQILSAARSDIVKCYKVVKSFNPQKSPVTSTDIKSLLIYEVLPVTKLSKDSMAVCVFKLVEKLLKLLKLKTCEQALRPDLIFGYTYPRQLFRCHRDIQLYNLSKTFETVYSRLKNFTG